MLAKLEHIDLRDNYISVLKPNHIKKLDRLDTLLLSGNELKAIEAYSFAGKNLRQAIYFSSLLSF
jgi:Leucine-rich repeat (LRR) protein